MHILTIADRKIGPDYPPLVIAEVGINHEASSTRHSNWSMPPRRLAPSW